MIFKHYLPLVHTNGLNLEKHWAVVVRVNLFAIRFDLVQFDHPHFIVAS